MGQWFLSKHRRVVALAAIAMVGLACGPKVEVQEPNIEPYAGVPSSVAFGAETLLPTENSALSTTAVPTTAPTTVSPATALPPTAATTTEAPAPTTTSGGLVLDLGLGDLATTVAPPVTTFVLDLGELELPTTTPTDDSVEQTASPFCRAASTAHAFVSAENVADASMLDYADALDTAAALAPSEVQDWYQDLAVFTRRLADEATFTGASTAAESLFARQPAVSEFVEDLCGFSLL